MKARKWLFIIIAILLVVNGGYYFVFKVIGLDNFLRDRLEASFASRTNSRVSIQKLDFNDKRLTIFGLTSQNDDYSLKIESVTIDYNLFFLPFLNFLPRKAISKIMVYKPSLTAKMDVGDFGKRAGKSGLDKLVALFPDFAVVEGSLDFDIKSKGFALQDEIELFSCSYAQEAENRMVASFYVASESRKLEGDIAFVGGVLDSYRVQIDSFALPGLKLADVDSLGFFLNGYAYGSQQTLQTDLELKNAFVKSGKLQAKILQAKVFGDDSLLKISVEKAGIMGTPVRVNCSLQNALQTDMQLFANVRLGNQLQIDDIYAKRSRQNDEISWEIQRAFWLGNKLSGDFVTDYKSFSFSLADESFVVQEKDFRLQSSLKFLASWDKSVGFQADFFGEKLQASSKNFVIDSATLQGHLLGSDFSASLQLRDSLANFDFSGNIFADSCAVNFRSQEFDPNLLLKHKNRYLPLCRVSSAGFLRKKVLHSKIDIFLEDSYYGLVSGSFGSQFLYDFEQGQLDMRLRSYKATFNYNLFELDLHAQGSFDSLMVDDLVLNEKLRGKFLLTKQKRYRCSGFLVAESLSLARWQKYFPQELFSQNLNGKLSLSLQVAGSGELDLRAKAKNVSYGRWQGVDANFGLQGSLDSLQVKEAELICGEDTVIFAKGKILSDSALSVKGNIVVNSLDLNKLQAESQRDWFGVVNGDLSLDYSQASPTLRGKLACRDFGYRDLRFSKVLLDFYQNKESLVVPQFNFFDEESDESLAIKGELGYNLLSGSFFPSDKKLQLYYQGDFLRYLSQLLPFIKSPESSSRLALNLGMTDKGLSIKEGAFVLKNGQMEIASQPEDAEDIQMDLRISNDTLFVQKFQARIGEGKLNFSNDFAESDKNLVLGNLNLGKIYFWTSGGKVSFNYPDYMDDNAVGKVRVKGLQDGEKAFVQGPADNMLISVQFCISDAQAMFPKKSRNLLNLISETATISQPEKAVKLPFFIEMQLLFEDNVYYKTYPMNLLVSRGSFLDFRYEKDDQWQVTRGEFRSTSGDMEIFSSVFTAKNVDLLLSQTNSLFDLNAEFEAIAVDGSTVSLFLKTIDKSKFALTKNTEIELASTDKDLTSDMQIISSLKYDISQDNSQTGAAAQAAMNSQVLGIVGDGVQSQVLDLFISPVENSLQRALRLDLFRIKMNVVQNILEDYDNQQNLNQEQTAMDGSDILLNKMKISLGKSLTNRLFVVSEFKVEESDDPLVEKRKLLLNQKVGFRYILPYNFRFQYNYNFSEDVEKNLYELNLRKSIDF